MGTEMEKFKRWLDVFLVIVFATAIIWLLFVPFLLPLSEWLNRQHTANRLIYILLASSSLWFFIKTTGGTNIKGIIRYPSSWFISILLFLLFCATELFFNEKINTNKLSILFLNLFAIFLGVMIASMGCCIFEQKDNRKHKHIGRKSSILNNPKEIIEWSLRELPIDEISEDLFNHKYVAEKIKKILKSSPNKNVGIIGGFGSGKSSIINLIMSQRSKKDIYCKIEGWGFKEDTAIEHILQLIIEELKNNFDCLSIYNVPKQYHDAMTNSGNYVFSFLSVFIQGTRNPEKILRKIDNTLQCLNKKLFIILEDIDRNVNDATFYNEIASFLNVTKKLNRISFIVALSPKEQLNPVLVKLCEYNEYIQRIDNHEVIRIFDSLIDYFHTKFPEDKIIKNIEEIKSSLGIPRNSAEYDIMQALDHKTPIDFIVQLLDTPRKLKGVIRGMYIAWGNLHGEINFELLLLATILRTAAPEAYSFINENIQSLRNLIKSTASDQKSEEIKFKQLLNKWENITKDVSWDSEAARQIICILFPAFMSQGSGRWVRYALDKNTLQGIADSQTTDYWKRINIGRLSTEEIGDQTILKAMKAWQENHSNKGFVHNGQTMTLADAIFQLDSLSDKIEQFGTHFESKEICELASELFKMALEKDGNKAEEGTCPCFTNLWRLYHKKNCIKTEHENWLIDEIKKALDISLHFSIDLYYYWRHTTNHSVQSKEATPELRKKVVEIFREKFEGKPENLVKIMEQGNPWGLYHLIYLERESEPEKWDWLGNVLLSAAKIDPKLILSYVACLISETKRVHIPGPDRSDSFDNKINYDAIKEIFGDNVKAVMELFSKEFEYPELADDFHHAQTRSVIQSDREEAKAWLKTH
ncbi:MAG: hypothetical protein A2173_02675 [Planctomycetes bacterium RBG_13_44_8b]|nr:MAG: hypothetical protein A2173_02675 [Planctomycetes bacterium RBG_13_44_8b]